VIDTDVVIYFAFDIYKKQREINEFLITNPGIESGKAT
jgi:hypothetical protein